jgi:glycosyltransferase involved in cell wall biosynthesis
VNTSKIFNLNDANGGTEILARKFEEYILPLVPEFNNYNWIIAPGLGQILKEKINIAWIHLGEYEDGLEWVENPYLDYLIFVSEYQKQSFLNKFNIDKHKCYVINNFINNINYIENKPTDVIKIAFHVDPERGLELLIKAMNLISDPKIELHVFGDFLKNKKYLNISDKRIFLHEKINNESVIKFISNCHIFAYPSICNETSSMCLIEALSSGLYCITNDLSVLPETGMGLTDIYKFQNDIDKEYKFVAEKIISSIELIRSKSFDGKNQSEAVNSYYSIDKAIKSWKSLSKTITNDIRP